MENKPIIIGVTGAFGSGKSTAAAFFQEKGFKQVTLSLFLEEELRKRRLGEVTRRKLQDTGNELRKKYGSGVLAKTALKKIENEGIKKAVIDGIRNVGEIEVLRNAGKFVLVAIVVDREVRFERLKKLKRRETLTWELFTKLDKRDLGLGQKSTGLHVASCQALADIFIPNNGTKEKFEQALSQFLKKTI